MRGLASWKDGRLTHYSELAGKTVLSILEDHEATIWAAAWGVGSTEGRLFTIRDGRVQCYGDDGRLGNGIDGPYEDRGGKLWAGTVNGVWRWTPEPAKFFPMAIITSSFAEGDGGELFIATLDGIRRLVNEQPGPYLLRAAGQLSRFGKLLRDRDGGLWVGTYDGGLLHVYRGRTHRFTQVQVTVEDSGIGLDPEKIARIFDAFYTTKSGGMGMGLSISRSIVQNHGGRLWATANDGPGTSFHFSLPKYRGQESIAGVAGL